MDVDAARLPHWARVAFAARCARLAFPLFDECWPLAGAVYRGYVLEAIRVAELSARAGGTVDGTREAVADVGQAAGRPQLPFLYPDLPDDEDEPDQAEGNPPNKAAAGIATLAANAARHASRAAQSPPARSAQDAEKAWGFLVGAAHQHRRRELIDRAAAEFALLRTLAKRERWMDDMPMSGGVFARLEDIDELE